MSITCGNGVGPAKTCIGKTPTTAIKVLFATVPGFSFTDAASFATRADWLTAIAAGSIIPIIQIREQENMDFEDPIIETTNGEKISTFEGQYGTRYKTLYPLDQHKLVRLMDGGNYGIYKADRNNNLQGWLDTDDTIQPFTTSFFKVWKQQQPDAENPPYTNIDIQEDDPGEWNGKGFYLTPTWGPSRLDGILNVRLTAGAIALGVFVASVNYVNVSTASSAGVAISKAVTGLVDANFKIYNDSGTLLTPTTDYTAVAVAGSDGDYTIDTTAGTPIVADSTCQVVPSSIALYQSTVVTLT